MSSSLARLALLAALPAGLLASSAAQATTVPGCFGAVVVACDPTVTVTLPGAYYTYDTTIPVCAGPCVDVPVTLVGTQGDPTPGSVCVSYENRAGSVVYRRCQPLDPGSPEVPDVPDLPDLPEVPDVDPVLQKVFTIAERELVETLCLVNISPDGYSCW
ncbi:MAG TPA: hypothetical protein VF519_11475 [Mycobacteriales bacterium]|jgi:hypothetical protein